MFVARPVRVQKFNARLAQLCRHHRLVTLAIESSCDDTCIAILRKHNAENGSSDVLNAASKLQILHHDKVTADNRARGGIDPIVSLESHQANLARLVSEALRHLPASTAEDALENTIHVPNVGTVKKPDFISVTRGPGSRSSLFTGLDTAKGLSVAWQRPLLAVNHMQAHALTPRLVSALEQRIGSAHEPAFPFLSLLVSGGHSLLLHSKALADHEILATTHDEPLGNCIDKIARETLPAEWLAAAPSTMYGRTLEEFAFPDTNPAYAYEPPRTREQQLRRVTTPWGWSLVVPLAETKGGWGSRAMQYSFSGLYNSAKRVTTSGSFSGTIEERRCLAREAMRVAFEHLASRVVFALQDLSKRSDSSESQINTLVVSGGVAANKYLRHVLRAYLDMQGYAHVSLAFPPVGLCTDNAIMIGWTGIEMFEAGFESGLDCLALKKWALDPNAPDGGILGVPGWKLNTQQVTQRATKVP